MIDGISIRDRADSLGLAIRDTLAESGQCLLDQASNVVDAPRWRAAISLRERTSAALQRQINVIAGFIAVAVVVILFACGVFGHPPGPSSLPAEREMRLRAEAVSTFNPTPPPGLVAANRSVPQPASPETSQ